MVILPKPDDIPYVGVVTEFWRFYDRKEMNEKKRSQLSKHKNDLTGVRHCSDYEYYNMSMCAHYLYIL